MLLAPTLAIWAQPKLTLVSDLNFLKMPVKSPIATPTGVAIDSKGHIFVTHSGPMKLMEFDEDGTFIRALLPELLVGPHGVRIDKEDNIWVTDMELQMVFKLNP